MGRTASPPRNVSVTNASTELQAADIYALSTWFHNEGPGTVYLNLATAAVFGSGWPLKPNNAVKLDTALAVYGITDTTGATVHVWRGLEEYSPSTDEVTVDLADGAPGGIGDQPGVKLFDPIGLALGSEDSPVHVVDDTPSTADATALALTGGIADKPEMKLVDPSGIPLGSEDSPLHVIDDTPATAATASTDADFTLALPDKPEVKIVDPSGVPFGSEESPFHVIDDTPATSATATTDVDFALSLPDTPEVRLVDGDGTALGSSSSPITVDLDTQAANAAVSTASEVLLVQNVAADGTAQPSGSLVTNPVHVRLSNGAAAAEVSAANTGRAVGTIVQAVQSVAADGTVPPSGSLVTNPPYVRLSNGTDAAEVSAANTGRAVGTIVQAVQNVSADGTVQPSGSLATNPVHVELVDGTNPIGSASNPLVVSESSSATAVAIAGTPQNLTGAAVALGAEINTTGKKSLVLFLTIDINDSLNVRIQPAYRATTGGADHSLPNLAVGSSDVKFTVPLYYELDVDADTTVALELPLNGCVPFLMIYVWAGTVGATAGQIDAASYVMR